LHWEKQHPQTIAIVDGIRIDFNSDQRNTLFSIRFNFEFGSNEIDPSNLRLTKQYTGMVSIDNGAADFNPEVRNAFCSIRCNSEPAQNVTGSNKLYCSTWEAKRTAIDSRIRMLSNDPIRELGPLQ
jgi:hypothetical protein